MSLLISARQRVRQRDGRSPDQHAGGSGNGNRSRNGNGNGNERRSGSGNDVGEGREPDPVKRGGWAGSVEMVYSSVLVDEMRKRLPLPQVGCCAGPLHSILAHSVPTAAPMLTTHTSHTTLAPVRCLSRHHADAKRGYNRPREGQRDRIDDPW